MSDPVPDNTPWWKSKTFLLAAATVVSAVLYVVTGQKINIVVEHKLPDAVKLSSGGCDCKK